MSPITHLEGHGLIVMAKEILSAIDNTKWLPL